MRSLIFIITLFTFATAYAETASREPSVKVLKYRGAIQCDQKSGTPPEIMRNELVKAGIEVISVACGEDGKMHPMLCGTPTGAINIFEIPQKNAAQAFKLGFAKLDSSSGARETPCPAQ